MRIRFCLKLALMSLVLIFLGCASVPNVVKISSDTYMLTRVDKGGSFGDVATTKQDLIRDANSFAERQGKVAVKISMKENATPIQGFISIEYKFQLMDKIDAELLKTDLETQHEKSKNGEKKSEIQNHQTQFNNTYDALIKLEELHKRGILTDDEFAIQKKKILEMS